MNWSVISLLVHVKGPLTDPGIYGQRKHSVTRVLCESSVCFDDVKVVDEFACSGLVVVGFV